MERAFLFCAKLIVFYIFLYLCAVVLDYCNSLAVGGDNQRLILGC